jgi:hypothetical protein
VFAASLDLRLADAPVLIGWLRETADPIRRFPRLPINTGSGSSPAPMRYISRRANLRAAWIIPRGENFPRFVSAFVEQAVNSVNVLDPVALLIDRPDPGLGRGQLGTVVEALADGVFEVEFDDSEGWTYAFAALPAEALLVLRTSPAAV